MTFMSSLKCGDMKYDSGCNFLDECGLLNNLDHDRNESPGKAGQLRQESAGGAHHTRHPLQHASNSGSTWDLGTVERIRLTAQACNFCHVVSQLLHGLEQDGKCVDSKFFCEVVMSVRGNYGFKDTDEDEQLTDRKPGKALNSLSFRFTEVRQAEGRTDEARQLYAMYWAQAYNLPRPAQLFNDVGIFNDMPLFGGRKISPLLPIEMILSWKEECTPRHKASCCITSMHRSSRISIFRLIDVNKKAIVRLSNVDIADLHYIALSYVWGKGAQKTILTRSNKNALGMLGALEGIVSTTIEDAIDLTKLLGLQYIWVDALCIVQDDVTDKSHHLAFMDQVYRYAEITVIAASGKDANAGLPGLREPRRIQQHTVKVKDATTVADDLYLITSSSIRPVWRMNYLEGTEWSTRGWTLKEKVMSRRTLIFTDTEIYWGCRGGKWAEGLYSETNLVKPRLYDFGAGSGFLGGEVAEPDDGSPWDDLQVQIADFSSRNFTVDGDAYSAFSGVLQEFSRLTGERFLWAIPASRFEIGLCWYRQWKWRVRSGADLTRRTGLSTVSTTTLDCNVPFPSWSWLGWKGHIQTCFTAQYRETGMYEEVACFVVRNTPLRVVKVSRITSDSTEIPTPPMLHRASHLNPNIVTLEAIMCEYPQLTEEKLRTTADNQLIAFWSEVAVFATVGPVRKENDFYYDHNFSSFDIYALEQDDGGRQKCGQTELCSPGDENDPLIKAGEGRFEFVLLATTEVLENDPAEDSLTKDLRVKSELPPKKRLEKVVIQITRHGHEKGVASRICTARIREGDWNEASPQRKLVILN